MKLNPVAAVFSALVLVTGVLGQSQAESPSFDVATVKPSPPPGDPNRVPFVGGPRDAPGRAVFYNVPLKYLVMVAYGLTSDWSIEGGPNWFKSETFDIEATFPLTTPRAQIPLMLRNLLADRFKLATHMQPKERAVYALVIGSSGPKLKPSDGLPVDPRAHRIATGHMEEHGVTMHRIADLLSTEMRPLSDRPVIDATRLTGLFDFTLDWAPDSAQKDGAPPPTGPSIFTAINEQLGLKLEARTMPVDVLQIDYADRPPSN